jgi:hypothetical protein
LKKTAEVIPNTSRTIHIAVTNDIFTRGQGNASRQSVSEILVTNAMPQTRDPEIRCLDIVPLLPAIW